MKFPLPCSREKPVSSTSRTLIRSLQDDCDKKTGERKKERRWIEKKNAICRSLCMCCQTIKLQPGAQFSCYTQSISSITNVVSKTKWCSMKLSHPTNRERWWCSRRLEEVKTQEGEHQLTSWWLNNNNYDNNKKEKSLLYWKPCII